MIHDTDHFTPEAVERAAKAVSPHSAHIRLLTKDNFASGAEQLWTRDFANHPFMVRLSCEYGYHTIALDFDDKCDDDGRADNDSLRAMRLLTALGVNAVRTASGSAGGRHVLVTLHGHLRPWDAQCLVEGLIGLGLRTLDRTCLSNPATGSIRPPLSVHRSGVGRSIPVDLPLETALTHLESRNDPAHIRMLARELDRLRAHWPLPVGSPGGAGVGADPARARTDLSGSGDVQAIITAFVDQRLTRGACLNHLQSLSPSTAAGQTIARHRRAGDLHRWFTTSWKAAERHVAKNPRRHTGADDAMVIAAWSDTLPLVEPGLTGATRRAARLLLRKALECRRALVGFSGRQLAAEMNMDHRSARRALGELEDLGMIKVAGQPATNHGTRYWLLPSSSWTCIYAPVSTPTPHTEVRLTGARTHACTKLATDFAADLWHAKGLGEPARFTYEHLVLLGEADGTTASAVALATGVSEGQARRHLSSLVRHRLARRLGNGRVVPEWRPADEVADEIGTLGEHARLLQRLEDDRIEHNIGLLLSRIDRRRQAGQYRLDTSMNVAA